MAASYPSATKSFSTKTAGQTISEAHVNDLQDEVVAIEAGLRDGLAHDVKPLTDAANDLGTSSKKWRDAFLSRNVLIGGTLGVTGAITATAGQIAFPATQSASSDANTLDDYEEGSWTPTIGGTGGQSGQVYTTQVGRYVKVGKKVHVQGRVTLSTLGTITTGAAIKGLPFTAENTANAYSCLCVAFFASLNTSVASMSGFVEPNTTQMQLRHVVAGGATGVVTTAQADLSNTFDIGFSAEYMATA